MKMTAIELKTRLKDWAVMVVLFTKKFPHGQEFNAVRGQIVRSAGSVQKTVSIKIF
jgi:hypothetical protein